MTLNAETLSSEPYPDTLLFIDGEWRNASDGAAVNVTDPATNAPIGLVARATTADLDLAVAAVERGFAVWSTTSAHERARLMRKAAELVRARAALIATLMTREQGKPLAEAQAEVLAAADIIDWFAEEGRRAYGQIIPARDRNVSQVVLRMPVGPVAAFTPWNFPVNQIVRKLSAALAAGCSIIVKAPGETPASPAELIRAFDDAGIPRGVINLVHGSSSEISSHLIPHPAIRKISFTGSTPVGKHLAALAGQHMKLATMELGGHAPALIFEDADIERAVATLCHAKYRNAGQVCVSPTRFLVQESVYDRVVEAFTATAQSLLVGNGLDEGVQMGPLANERRLTEIETLIEDAVAKGARLTTGGHRIGNTGNFFAPTVLADVPLEARIFSEEPFGPVAAFRPFATLDDAIAEANRLPFGLASYAFTSSAETAGKLSLQIEAGMTGINHYGLGLPETPFGGIKDSGHGTEGGSQAIEAYLTTRFVSHRFAA